ncbi:MAG: 16S rRNA (uracil(1498)-N(3))-methyltransferase [Alphaproteobacteria bacterium]|nr:16S rRNA (uracil(1498)-N(3))-methyltransferase [Alphaproteobacteria bacterium]MCD8520122.1 16S rRNA (uracil(1498)-N(3))-methyltransferase [Alphaproteobacteria bacterium]MCD8571089.1 16S rRNA (uracil(1498)-N(3))-methyltransferase [Alphaproteobacteria bacterium]
MSNLHTLPRLFVNDPLQTGGSALLNTPQSHYLRNVLRKKEGDELRLFNGRDGEFIASLEAIGKKEAIVRIQEQIIPQPSAPPRIHLICAPIKKNRMDILIEKAVELGVTDLHPVITERTEARKINEDRLAAQMIEALEQCERLEKPVLHPAHPFEKLLGSWQGPDILLCAERHDAPHLLDFLDKTTPAAPPALLIGPEGGFSPKEIEKALSIKACHAISLGPAILRAETAALHALGITSAYFCKSSGGGAKIG